MYRITVTDEQLRCLKIALEDYFRLRMGQFMDYTDDLTLACLPPNPSKDVFNDAINRRNDAKVMFEYAFRHFINPDYKYETVSQNARICEDMWQVIRHQIWLDDDQQPEWSVDSREPLPVTDRPLIIVERIGDTSGVECLEDNR